LALCRCNLVSAIYHRLFITDLIIELFLQKAIALQNNIAIAFLFEM
jgi:hypothetical protein